MILKAFAVYDVKAEVYGRPFFLATKGLAIRSFADAAQDKNLDIGKYPSDYTLFEIGTFDDSCGMLKPLDANVPLGTALEYLREQPEWREQMPESGQGIHVSQ